MRRNIEIAAQNDLGENIADWSAPAPDFTFYLFGSWVRSDHGADSDVDLLYVLGASEWGQFRNLGIGRHGPKSHCRDCRLPKSHPREMITSTICAVAVDLDRDLVTIVSN